MNFKNKKVLLVGLGILGGGVSTAKWLIEQGAKLTITDIKDEKYLKKSISRLKGLKIKYVLGEHREKDFLASDLAVVNQDVPLKSHFIQFALKNKVPVLSELSIFSNFCLSERQVAVTGTRGKTTTVNWIAFILRQKFPRTQIAGNSPKNPLLTMLKKIKTDDPVVLEVPSYQLEYPAKNFRPRVAVITNIYRDHVNRHGSVEEYAKAKMAIFANQKKGDYLILNYDNKWTKEILKKSLKQNISFYSLKKLPKIIKDGIYLDDRGNLILRNEGVESVAMSSKHIPKDFGEHNVCNLMIGILVGNIFDIDSKVIEGVVDGLPTVLYRQEKIFDGKHKKQSLKVYNDSTATSPEATIAAINRFHKDSFFIIGGTDKDLAFKDLAKNISQKINSEDVVFLTGSATDKLLVELKKKWKNIVTKDSLEECLIFAEERISNGKKYKNLVFSPAAKSFEKFKNEYDRGVQFNKLFARVFR